jgi:glycosyltransferase involved in cell wall biosynthesis
MRIAQIAPLWERVPPATYGGIELVVGLLTDELVRRGHKVTLFATGDSESLADLVSVHTCALRLDPTVKDPSSYELLQIGMVYERAADFDIIHSHMGHSSLTYASLVKTPTVHTLHGIFTSDNQKIYKHARKLPYVSISNAQRNEDLGLNYVATVYNGIDVNAYEFYPQPADPPYLAFLGRMSPEKGVHLAIEIAQKSGWRLKLAGKVDAVDKEYFAREVKPHIDGKQIEFLGEADHKLKNTLLGGAIATLFPTNWLEPFGLVMVESMAAGTPVIAIRLGSTPEVIADEETGFLCNCVEACVDAISQIEKIDRYTCRKYVESRFDIQHMTDGYEAVYQKVLGQRFSDNGHFCSRKAELSSSKQDKQDKYVTATSTYKSTGIKEKP